jgi:hypothetical protein
LVCEAYADRPRNDDPNACRCGEPGMPCPVCNVPEEGELPVMPRGFTPHFDVDKGQHIERKEDVTRCLMQHVNVAPCFFAQRFAPRLPPA